MADVTDVFDDAFKALPNFYTGQTPDAKSLLDTFRDSPRLMPALDDFRRQGGQIRLGEPGRGNKYLPRSGQNPPLILVDPQEPFLAPLAIAGLLAHELGHALRSGGSVPGLMEILRRDTYLDRTLGQEAVAIVEEYIVLRELNRGFLGPPPLGYDNATGELTQRLREIETRNGGTGSPRKEVKLRGEAALLHGSVSSCSALEIAKAARSALYSATT